MVDKVAAALPDEHLESLLIHEFGHFLFIAESDEHHCTDTGPNRMLQCEKLVWDLTGTWGVDITEAELWMRRYFIDNKAELQLRETPLPYEETRRGFVEKRAPILEKMATFEFPQKYFKFRGA
ncbi:hypothetical protein GC197_09825 [bacterium]|nr:hypothetical protein [bacterium]